MIFDYHLTKRELEMCGMVAQGLSSKQIARRLFLTNGTVKNYFTTIYEKTGVSNRAQLVAKYVKEYTQTETVIDPAENISISVQPDVKLWLVGAQELPHVIPITFQGKQPFVIGRYDINIGRKQCDFEFGKTTKAVSCRHASFESTSFGTAIMDLESRAGTFINGEKIIPGNLHVVKRGDRVSFGTAGADYVFEE